MVSLFSFFVLLGKVSRQQNRMAVASVYVSSSHREEPHKGQTISALAPAMTGGGQLTQ